MANSRLIVSAAKEKGKTASQTKQAMTNTAPQLWKRKFRVLNHLSRNSRCMPRRKCAPKTWDIKCKSTLHQTEISKVTSTASGGTLNRNWSALWHAPSTDEQKAIGSDWKRSNRDWTFPEERKGAILIWFRTNQAKREKPALIMWFL